MKRALFFVNDIKPESVEDYLTAAAYLNSIGWEHTRIPMNEPESLYDFGMVFGGDGTFLWAAQIFSAMNLPMAGVNTGTLGFLPTIRSEDIIPAIDRIIKGEYRIEECMMINAYRPSDGGDLGNALNDIVLKNKMEHNVGHFKIYVNDTLLYDISADGVIISTPTGSTAYVLSLGGPLVAPSCRLMIIQPIAPHTLNSRAVAVDSSQSIKVVFDEQKTSISRDGRMIQPNQGSILIKKADMITKIIRFKDYDFYKTVSEKLNRG
ncbi:MAG: NAD(+)/NADH kinase [Eubacteriaceae bacterium]|nr:NAD(+)/NADH kinase [Eubacteriaceae bacterium]